jgi:hypothetical protein
VPRPGRASCDLTLAQVYQFDLKNRLIPTVSGPLTGSLDFDELVKEGEGERRRSRRKDT